MTQTKQDQIDSLKLEIAALNGKLDIRTREAARAIAEKRDAESLLRSEKSNSAYYQNQLNQCSDSWAKKWDARETEVEKKIALIVQSGLTAIKETQNGYENLLKTQDDSFRHATERMANLATLKIAQAESSTLAYAFEHVTAKLSEKHKVG